jgi:hypothetical protein
MNDKVTNLFSKVCTCGMIGGDTCTIAPKDCPEFREHQRQAIARRDKIKLKCAT